MIIQQEVDGSNYWLQLEALPTVLTPNETELLVISGNREVGPKVELAPCPICTIQLPPGDKLIMVEAFGPTLIGNVELQGHWIYLTDATELKIIGTVAPNLSYSIVNTRRQHSVWSPRSY